MIGSLFKVFKLVSFRWRVYFVKNVQIPTFFRSLFTHIPTEHENLSDKETIKTRRNSAV